LTKRFIEYFFVNLSFLSFGDSRSIGEFNGLARKDGQECDKEKEVLFHGINIVAPHEYIVCTFYIFVTKRFEKGSSTATVPLVTRHSPLFPGFDSAQPPRHFHSPLITRHCAQKNPSSHSGFFFVAGARLELTTFGL
jgi:hypothetical protein